MKCTAKERETCNVEKMGCEGCYYYIPDEIKKKGKKTIRELKYTRYYNLQNRKLGQ